MKKKFLILALCFTIVFSSINYKKIYADGGTLSIPILATVSSLAVGTGIVLNNLDDVYDIGRMFYDYVNSQKELGWATVQTAFLASTTMVGNKVNVEGSFLDIVKGFFDNKFDKPIYYHGDIPTVAKPRDKSLYLDITDNLVSNGEFYLGISLVNSSGVHIPIKATFANEMFMIVAGTSNIFSSWVGGSPDFIGIGHAFTVDKQSTFYLYSRGSFNTIKFGTVAFPYEFDYTGGYGWDNVKDRIDDETGDLPLPIPSNLDKLVGQTSDNFWSNTEDLSTDGSFDISDISSPSISIDKTQTITGTNSGVGDAVKPSLPSLPSWGSGLDFSPITKGVFTDKFPFCLAKDIGDIISVFDVPSRNLKEPVFEVPFLGEELVLDFREFKLWFDIVKFFILIGFIISLIVLTRGIIG